MTAVESFTKAWKDAMKSKNDVLLLASSEYCPYCVAFLPEWDKYTKRAPSGVVTMLVDGNTLAQALNSGAVRLPVPFAGVPFVVAVPGGQPKKAADFDDFLRDSSGRWKTRSSAALAAFSRATFVAVTQSPKSRKQKKPQKPA